MSEPCAVCEGAGTVHELVLGERVPCYGCREDEYSKAREAILHPRGKGSCPYFKRVQAKERKRLRAEALLGCAYRFAARFELDQWESAWPEDQDGEWCFIAHDERGHEMCFGPHEWLKCLNEHPRKLLAYVPETEPIIRAALEGVGLSLEDL